ncbi:MAG: hypothetical protein K2G38_01240 [Clostridia bacterium]|nr:hypothetical protein [Clostridia bacterium]
MKKFVTTLLALLLTVALAVGFTACKDEENEGYNEVTEEVWKSALNLFSGDPAKINTDDLNLTVNLKDEANGETYNATLKYDYTNKAYCCSGDDVEYAWVEGDVLYFYMEDTYNGVTYKSKEVQDSTYLEFVAEELTDNTVLGAVVDVDSHNLINRYSACTYNADSGCYIYTFNDTEEDWETGKEIEFTVDVKIYFSGEKVAKLEYLITGGYTENITETYTYGPTNVTIPDEVKNTPVSN